MEYIQDFLQGAGILTILVFCLIIGASIETGRENDARRARAEKRSTESTGDDNVLTQHSANATTSTPDQHPAANVDVTR